MTKTNPAPRVGGFTLMELMLVVVIIGILATVLVPSFYRTATRSKVNQATGVVSADLEQASPNALGNGDKTFQHDSCEITKPSASLGAPCIADQSVEDDISNVPR
jgi:prepilin-type N-terminal cleavage/methylation domain-containing protein